MSLGNGEYLFPDASNTLKAGKLLNEKGHPPAGTIVINPKTKEQFIEWLDRIGVKHDVKPIPQEVKAP